MALNGIQKAFSLFAVRCIQVLEHECGKVLTGSLRESRIPAGRPAGSARHSHHDRGPHLHRSPSTTRSSPSDLVHTCFNFKAPARRAGLFPPIIPLAFAPPKSDGAT